MNNKNANDKKNKWKIVLIIFLVLILLLGSVAGVFIYNVNKNGGGIKGVITTVVGGETEVVNLDTFYCVLLGQSQNLTDTIMLAAYNPKEQKASLLSIQRDTYVGKNRNRANAFDKINALCQYNYPEKTVKAVAEITGIDVEKYVLIDTKALREAVDLIGGVYFDVPVDMKYTDVTQDLYIDVRPGYQLLNGDKAEQVVRFRHNDDGSTYPEEYGSEDIGRTKTQRNFLMELAKQTLTIQNLTKIGGFLDIFYKNVKTNVTLDEIKEYLPHVVQFNMDDLKTGYTPGEPELFNSLSFYVLDKDAMKDMVNNLFGNIETKKGQEKIQILNGTGDSEVGEEIEAKLKKAGYNVESLNNTTESEKTSIINRAETSVTVNEVKKLIGVGIVTESNNKEDSITIILGKDIKKAFR